MAKNPLKFVSNRSSHNFVAHVTKTDTTIVFHGAWVFGLRNECDDRGVPVVHAFPLIDYFKNFVGEVVANGVQVILEEMGH